MSTSTLQTLLQTIPALVVGNPSAETTISEGHRTQEDYGGHWPSPVGYFVDLDADLPVPAVASGYWSTDVVHGNIRRFYFRTEEQMVEFVITVYRIVY